MGYIKCFIVSFTYLFYHVTDTYHIWTKYRVKLYLVFDIVQRQIVSIYKLEFLFLNIFCGGHSDMVQGLSLK